MKSGPLHARLGTYEEFDEADVVVPSGVLVVAFEGTLPVVLKIGDGVSVFGDLPIYTPSIVPDQPSGPIGL